MKTIKQLCFIIGSAAAIGSVHADQQILDDLIVDGSVCAGQDCVNGENFGFDTLRLRENNLRLHFDDTSTTASFPSNDWRLVANDSDNGGANHFSIEDSTAGRTPVRIEAGAPSNSLVVDTSGRVGLGTQSPVVELHVVSGDSPTLRLEQDGSSGFTPQTWDMASNEANFFIRDVTNGSQLPFRIEPGADTNALYIDSDNNIGVGTNAPTSSLHVRRTDASARLLVEEANASVAERILLELINRGGSQIEFEDSSTDTRWQMGSRNVNNDFEITRAGSGGVELLIEAATNNMTIRGALFTGGTTCGTGCDMVFEKDYDLPTIEEHNAEMWSKGYLPNVGPTIENEPINLTDKTGRMLNELEKAHIFIGQLNARLAEKEHTIESLVDRLDRLESKIE